MTGKSLRTIAEMRDEDHQGYNPRGRPLTVYLDPAAGECHPLFTSAKFDDCLTHITRVVRQYAGWSFTTSCGRLIEHDAYESMSAWCGVQMSSGAQIPLADATGFGCWRCIARCEELGLPTYALIPDTGCAVSGGKRGLRLGQRNTPTPI